MNVAWDAPTDLVYKQMEAAGLLRAMSNERRLLALCLLARLGEVSVGAIADFVDLSQSATSQHLSMLRQDGLVATRRDGTNIYYRLSDARAVAILRLLIDLPRSLDDDGNCCSD